MKELLLKPDRSVNWKFILLMILASFITSIIYLAVEEYKLGRYQQLDISIRSGMIVTGKLSFALVFFLWAWIGHKNPLSDNRWVNFVLIGLLGGILSEVIRVSFVLAGGHKTFLDINEKDYWISALCVFDWLLTIVLCEVFSAKFKNKVLLYFTATAVVWILIDPFFSVIYGQYKFHPNSILRIVSNVVVSGMIAAIVFRIFKVRFIYALTPVTQIRQFIVARLKAGNQKPEIWNELTAANPDFPRKKLAKIFTTVSPYPDDLRELKLSQGYLIIYTLISCIPFLPSLISFNERSWHSTGFIFKLEWAHIFLILVLFLKLYMVYEYLHFRAYIYRLTVSLSLIIGVLSILLVMEIGGWIPLVSAILHFIAAWVAYHISSYVYPNYRLFYKPSPQYIEKL